MLTERELTWRQKRFEAILAWERQNTYEDFIDEAAIQGVLDKKKAPDRGEILAIIDKARSNTSSGAMLSAEDTAALAHTTDPELWDRIFDTANWIKTTRLWQSDCDFRTIVFVQLLR